MSDMQMEDDGRADRRGKPYFLLCSVVSILSAGLLFYSQTAAFAWDEGFHLLAAQLVKAGKRPYLDFVFSQTPLNAYWNAGWMWVFGESWRTAHAIAALLTGAAVMLTADFLFACFPVPRWRLGAALAVALAVGMNVVIVEFGTIAQAYGLCLFLIVAAFRLSVLAVHRKGLLLAGSAGCLAGAAAASSLLTASVAPVLVLWMLFYNRAGSRRAKLAAFLAGVAIPFLPLLRLFAMGPRQVFFGVIEYNLFHRELQWETATSHNVDVMLSWIDCSHALLLGLLAAAGLLFIAFRSEWDRRQRAEFYLCGWLALALGIHISTAHPTFQRYYLLLVPFLGILASAGLYWMAVRLYAPDRPLLPVLALTVLLSLGLAKTLYEDRDDYAWRDIEEIARKVDRVTPPHSLLLADEHVYFLTRRLPPSGMELKDSHKLEFSGDLAERLHVVSGTELDRRIKAGVFETIESCDEDQRTDELGLTRRYAQKATVSDCMVFWDRIPLSTGAVAPSGK
ncbi:MAG: hypothetical protein HY822_21185 [Acidobacteria bacterium]|nr:hypothetical protein [Acidobacteriota bacterium]